MVSYNQLKKGVYIQALNNIGDPADISANLIVKKEEMENEYYKILLKAINEEDFEKVEKFIEKEGINTLVKNVL